MEAVYVLLRCRCARGYVQRRMCACGGHVNVAYVFSYAWARISSKGRETVDFEFTTILWKLRTYRCVAGAQGAAVHSAAYGACEGHVNVVYVFSYAFGQCIVERTNNRRFRVFRRFYGSCVRIAVLQVRKEARYTAVARYVKDVKDVVWSGFTRFVYTG